MVGPVTNNNTNNVLIRTTGDGETGNVENGKPEGPGLGSGGGTGTPIPPPTGNGNGTGDGGVGGPTGDPGGQVDDLDEALERMNNDPDFREELLAALGLGGGAEEIVALMIKLSNMSRESALDQRLQARESAKSDLMASASETREAATKQIAAAIVSFVVATVSAVVSLAGSVSSLKSSTESLKQSKEANQLEKLSETAKLSNDKSAPKLTEQAKNAGIEAQTTSLAARRAADIGTATSQLTGGLGHLIGGSIEGAAKIDEAEGKEREASATDNQAQADIGKKIMDDVEEMVRSAIQFLKAMQSAEVDLMASMTRV